MRRVSRILSAVVFVVAACGGPSRPLTEEILGEWEVLCRTDKESTASCLGKENRGMYKIFRPGGGLVSGAREGAAWDGKWTLTGDALELVYEGGGLRVKEAYRARIEDGRLVLWDFSKGFGAVHGRVGAPFVPAASKTSAGGPTAHALGGVRYTLALPEGYRLSRDDNQRQEWSPSAGAGFVVLLSLSPRPQRQVDGEWVAQPCHEFGLGVGGERRVIDGVERDTAISRSLCLEGRDLSLGCSVEHTRGYLEPSELGEAEALCNSLAVSP